MRMRAALMPPRAVVEELADVVSAGNGATRELDAVPTAELHLRLTDFGNVAQGDAIRLEETMRRAADGWSPLQLRFSGGAALEWPGDDSVWARLDGDIADLVQLARSIPEAVQRLGFLLDRRSFRTWVRVGRITEATTGPYLESLVERLDAYRGSAWTVTETTLVRLRAEGVGEQWPSVEVYRRFPLGSSDG